MRTDFRTWISRLGLLPVVAALALAASPARAEDETTAGKDVVVEVKAGAQRADFKDGRYARFELYREVPNGAVIDLFRIDWKPKGKAWSADFVSRGMLQLDQRHYLDVSNAGKLRLRGSYVQTPHFFSNGSLFLHGGTDGVWDLSPTLRQGLETAASTSVSAISALMPNVVNSGPRVDVRNKRALANGELSLRLGRGWDLSLFGQQETRSGNRSRSIGTYIRRGGTGFDKENIESRGLEMLEPTRYTTDLFGLSTSFARKGGVITVGAEFGRFKNRSSVLEWDNVFEAPPPAATSTIGITPAADQEPSAAQGNTSSNVQRGRFPRAQLDLWPDNKRNRVWANGSLKLPGKTRLSATASVATMKSDDAFLPYTINEAVVFSGKFGQTDAVLAKDAARPATSFNGDVKTTRVDLRLNSNPVDPLRLRAAYRHYGYDDRSPSIQFPGYASAGDSFMRRGIGQKDAAGNRILFNEVGGYKREVWELGASYRIARAFTVDLGYLRTAWNYDERQVEKTKEDTFLVKARIEPTDRVTLRASWLDGSRRYDGTYDVGLETSGVRAYDVWDRDRSRYGIEADFELGERWTFGAAYSYWKDEYPGGVPTLAPPLGPPYGLQQTRNDSISGTLTYGKGDWSFGASLGYDTDLWDSLQVTKTSVTALDYDPQNRWARSEDDKVFWLGLNLAGKLGKKTSVTADVNWSDFKGDWTTRNLGTFNSNSAVAYPFPQFKDSFFSGKVALRHEVSSKVAFELRYWYEPYRLDDFTWDLMQPYMQGVYQETGGSATTLRPSNVSRYLFLDARYSDYDASVVTALVHFRF